MRISTALPPIEVRIRKLPHYDPALALPAYETRGAAGMDLRLCAEDRASATLEPGARAMLPTGLALALPDGVEAQVRPRSGLAAKHGVTVLNAPGTIDCDYRGEVKVILINHGDAPVTFQHGDRIAQMVFASCLQAAWVEVEELDETRRGKGGFGSTGQG